MKAAIKYLYISVFALLIGSVGALMLFKLGGVSKEEFATTEKRKPAELPVWKWDIKSVDNYFSQYDAFLNDNFSLRSQLVKLNSTIMLKAKLSTDNENVVVGKNGFLFLGNKWASIIDFTTGKRLLTPDELNNFCEYFSVRKNYLNNMGIELFLAIAPNKASVYSEYLPSHIRRSDNNSLQQVLALSDKINVMGFEKAIKAKKQEWGDSLYYKTDTHWSELGAYYGYLELMKALAVKLPKIEPVVVTKNMVKIEPFATGYDLANMLNVSNLVNDYKITLKDHQGWDFNLVKLSLKGDTLSYDALNNPTISVYEECVVVNPNKPYTVLLIRDSFSERLSVYLNQTFGRTIYYRNIDPEAIDLKSLVEKYKPDVVVEEIAERNITLYSNKYKTTDVIKDLVSQQKVAMN